MNISKPNKVIKMKNSVQMCLYRHSFLFASLFIYLLFYVFLFVQAPMLFSQPLTTNTPISYDETHSGTIASPIDVVTYNLNGISGENILVRVVVTSGNLDPEFRLFRPNGNLLCDGRTLGSFVERSCIIDANGNHTLLVNAWGGSTTGNFNIYLQRTTRPVNQINLPFDETQSDSITSLVELKAHTFTAAPRFVPAPPPSSDIKVYLPFVTGGGSVEFSDNVLVRMKATSGSLDPQFRVYRPDGSLLCSGQTLGSFVETLCQVDRSGDHAILAGAWNANATGSYDLYIQSTSYPANPTPIAYDETQSTAISPAVDLHAFTFDGTAGDPVLIRLQGTSGAIDPQFRVYRPNGTLLCNAQTVGSFVETTCTIDATGVHTILTGAWNANATGNLDLYIQSTNNPANPTPIAYDEVQSGGISPAIDLNAYTFSESSGTQLLIRMDVTSGALDPQIRVYRSNGSLLCSGQSLGSFVEISCLLDATGGHTILVGAWNANATGNYNLLLTQQ